MGRVRFSLVALGLFVLAFAGISWASRGFPIALTEVTPGGAVAPAVVPMVAVEPLKPSAAIPSFEQSVQRGLRKDWENSRTAQSDGDKERDKLRLELWQASIGYNLSPCDPLMKKNLVAALTNYVSAWATMAGCKSGSCNGNSMQIDLAATAFQTPADTRVHKALSEAIEKGGIAAADFPRALRDHVFMFSGVPFSGPPEACHGARRADARR